MFSKRYVIKFSCPKLPRPASHICSGLGVNILQKQTKKGQKITGYYQYYVPHETAIAYCKAHKPVAVYAEIFCRQFH